MLVNFMKLIFLCSFVQTLHLSSGEEQRTGAKKKKPNIHYRVKDELSAPYANTSSSLSAATANGYLTSSLPSSSDYSTQNEANSFPYFDAFYVSSPASDYAATDASSTTGSNLQSIQSTTSVTDDFSNTNLISTSVFSDAAKSQTSENYDLSSTNDFSTTSTGSLTSAFTISSSGESSTFISNTPISTSISSPQTNSATETSLVTSTPETNLVITSEAASSSIQDSTNPETTYSLTSDTTSSPAPETKTTTPETTSSPTPEATFSPTPDTTSSPTPETETTTLETTSSRTPETTSSPTPETETTTPGTTSSPTPDTETTTLETTSSRTPETTSSPTPETETKTPETTLSPTPEATFSPTPDTTYFSTSEMKISSDPHTISSPDSDTSVTGNPVTTYDVDTFVSGFFTSTASPMPSPSLDTSASPLTSAEYTGAFTTTTSDALSSETITSLDEYTYWTFTPDPIDYSGSADEWPGLNVDTTGLSFFTSDFHSSFSASSFPISSNDYTNDQGKTSSPTFGSTPTSIIDPTSTLAFSTDEPHLSSDSWTTIDVTTVLSSESDIPSTRSQTISSSTYSTSLAKITTGPSKLTSSVPFTQESLGTSTSSTETSTVFSASSYEETSSPLPKVSSTPGTDSLAATTSLSLSVASTSTSDSYANVQSETDTSFSSKFATTFYQTTSATSSFSLTSSNPETTTETLNEQSATTSTSSTSLSNNIFAPTAGQTESTTIKSAVTLNTFSATTNTQGSETTFLEETVALQTTFQQETRASQNSETTVASQTTTQQETRASQNSETTVASQSTTQQETRASQNSETTVASQTTTQQETRASQNSETTVAPQSTTQQETRASQNSETTVASQTTTQQETRASQNSETTVASQSTTQQETRASQNSETTVAPHSTTQQETRASQATSTLTNSEPILPNSAQNSAVAATVPSSESSTTSPLGVVQSTAANSVTTFLEPSRKSDVSTGITVPPDSVASFQDVSQAPATAKSSLETTSYWLPYSLVTTYIVTKPSASALHTTAPQTAIATSLPQAIYPQSSVSVPADYTVIGIAFDEAFNYEYLLNSYIAAAQIINFLPELLKYPFLHSDFQKREEVTKGSLRIVPNYDSVAVIEIVPYYDSSYDYILSVAKVSFPTASVGYLQALISNHKSSLYTIPDQTLRSLAALINSNIKIMSSSWFSSALQSGYTVTTQSVRQTITSDYVTVSNGTPITIYTTFETYVPFTATIANTRWGPKVTDNSNGSLDQYPSTTSMNSKTRKRFIIYITCLSVGFLLVWIVLFILVKTIFSISKLQKLLSNDLEKGPSIPPELVLPVLWPAAGSTSTDSQPDTDQLSHYTEASDGGHSQFNEKQTEGSSVDSANFNTTRGSLITEGTLRYFVDQDGNYYYAGESTGEDASDSFSGYEDSDSPFYDERANSEEDISLPELPSVEVESVTHDEMEFDEDGNVLIDMGTEFDIVDQPGFMGPSSELTPERLEKLLQEKLMQHSGNSANGEQDPMGTKSLNELLNLSDSGPTTDEIIANSIINDQELHEFLCSDMGSDSYGNSSSNHNSSNSTTPNYSGNSMTNYFSSNSEERTSDVSDVNVGEIDALDAEIYFRIKPYYEKALPDLIRQAKTRSSNHTSDTPE